MYGNSEENLQGDIQQFLDWGWVCFMKFYAHLVRVSNVANTQGKFLPKVCVCVGDFFIENHEFIYGNEMTFQMFYLKL